MELKIEAHLCKLPVITSIIWIVPISYCYGKGIHHPACYVLLILILNMSIFSCLFWIDPVAHRNSIFHCLDAFFARMTIIIFILYNLIFQIENTPFFTSMGTMTVFFYFSNYYSGRLWCCASHIFCHLCAHLFATLGIYHTLAFIENK